MSHFGVARDLKAGLLQKEIALPPIDRTKSRYFISKNYAAQSKNNAITKIVFFLQMSLLEYDEAITNFKKHYQQYDEEIVYYVLIKLLLFEGKKDLIVQEIKVAIKDGIKLRAGILKLFKIIQQKGELPDYMPNNW